MSAPKMVSDLSHVVENIEKYQVEIGGGKSEQLRERMGYARGWYAIRDSKGRWLFAPSKFSGYRDMNRKRYLEEIDRMDGRETERCLKEWFVELSPEEKLTQTLMGELRHFVASYGKTLNRLARINVLKDEPRRIGPKSERVGAGAGESWRITADPAILAGKPCIRGMRIRVADILELLAHGATRQQILEDYPYLEDGDITAALEYALDSVDHRLVKAA